MKRLLTITMTILITSGLSIVVSPVQPVTADPGVINVPGDQSTIQDAINVAISGDTVYVAAGTYYEHITLKSGVIVQGAGADVTTINGGGSGTVVTANHVNSAAMLDGFTITNGAASYGAGIYFTWSSATISNCIITNNIASYSGGGIEFKYSSSPTVSDCIITNNTAIYGGGIEAWFYPLPTITDSIISGNSAYWGGGIDFHYDANSTVSNCIIFDNFAVNGGGGINVGAASPIIVNNTITSNSTNRNGGGIHIDVSTLTISNNIISSNINGGIYADRSVSPTLDFNNVWGNSSYDYYGTSAGPNDISVDPLFESPATDDYHLQPSSPCIDAGDDTAVPSWLTTDFEGDPRIGGTSVDMGADEYYVSEFDVTVNAEADGSPLAVPITGVYDGSSVDGTTSYTINGVLAGYDVTLTAPIIHVEGSNVYVLNHWDFGNYNNDALDGSTMVTIWEDMTVTAYYLELENYVTGGGSIKHEVEKGNRTIEQVAFTFGGNVGISDTLGIVGNFQIVDHTGMKAEAWHCTTGDFISLIFIDEPGDLGAETPEASNDVALFIGDFFSNRGSEATIGVMIWDNQEPGKDFDMIMVVKWNEILEDWEPWIGPDTENPITLSGGNFQLHDYE